MSEKVSNYEQVFTMQDHVASRFIENLADLLAYETSSMRVTQANWSSQYSREYRTPIVAVEIEKMPRNKKYNKRYARLEAVNAQELRAPAPVWILQPSKIANIFADKYGEEKSRQLADALSDTVRSWLADTVFDAENYIYQNFVRADTLPLLMPIIDEAIILREQKRQYPRFNAVALLTDGIDEHFENSYRILEHCHDDLYIS